MVIRTCTRYADKEGFITEPGPQVEYGTIVSPHRYVRLSRIRKNARLFLAGLKSRMEVALEVG